MKNVAAILMVTLAWLSLRPWACEARSVEVNAAHDRAAKLAVLKQADGVMESAQTDENGATIVDDSCEQVDTGWYFLGPDKLIGFSTDSCAAAFQAWRTTTYPTTPLTSL